MPRVRKYDNNTTEAIIDAEMEITREFEDEERKAESPARMETTGPETKNGIVVNGLNVNVRKEANAESGVIEILRKGDRVKILDKIGNFYKVSTSVNRVAYISSDFIKEE